MSAGVVIHESSQKGIPLHPSSRLSMIEILFFKLPYLCVFINKIIGKIKNTSSISRLYFAGVSIWRATCSFGACATFLTATAAMLLQIHNGVAIP